VVQITWVIGVVQFKVDLEAPVKRNFLDVLRLFLFTVVSTNDNMSVGAIGFFAPRKGKKSRYMSVKYKNMELFSDILDFAYHF
jgi:hypothetical protein